jgi:hypothetical protein
LTWMNILICNWPSFDHVLFDLFPLHQHPLWHWNDNAFCKSSEFVILAT